MADEDWGDRENTQKGMYLRFNKKTKRWYLYNKRNTLVTSNRNKETLKNWRESE
jgi:hypothetical protein